MERKKRIVINTDLPIVRTGLAKNGRWLAEYLYNTNKYEIIYYACGVAWNNVEFQRLPYKIIGVMPENQAEFNQIQAQGDQAVREASYGIHNIDRVIKECQPDILIVSNDSWAYEKMMDKPWWSQINVIPHTTLDSVPFLDSQVKAFEKCKKVYVWAKFAVEEANRIGFKNVELLPPIIRGDHFYKLPRGVKLQLRNKYSIPQNAFIAVMCSRNQLRKEFKAFLQGYSIWKKENPSIKNTYCLLHTNFAEPAGWNFHKFAKELDIPESEILTTYFCRKCKQYDVKPYTGNDLNCQFCRGQKSQINVDIQNAPSEKQLNEIYNLCDCMVHLCNAGGAEMTPMEGLTCELPLIANGYSSMDTYVEKDFVFEVRNSFTVQLGTQFKRAVPNPNDVAKHLQKVYSMSQADRDAIGKKGREWVTTEFNANKVCKQWESIIDSMPLIDYSQIKLTKTANPRALIDGALKDDEWLTSLYKEILGAEPDESGFKYWKSEIKKGIPRHAIENQFRNIATQENPDAAFNTTSLESILEPDKNKKVLVVLKESIGDIICSTSLLDSIHNHYPAHNLYYACDPKYFDILKYNKNIYKCLPFDPRMTNEIWATGQGKTKGLFDVYINLGVQTQNMLNYLTNDSIDLPKCT